MIPLFTSFADTDRNNKPEPYKTPVLAGKHKKTAKFRAYRRQVRILTELVAHLIPGIEKRGWKEYHIDHIYPIWEGFNNNIDPAVIADIKNLRMMWWRDNVIKGRRITN